MWLNNSPVTWSVQGCFGAFRWRGGTALRGITRVMEARFFPNLRPPRASGAAPPPAAPGAPPRPRLRRVGRALGTLVDRQAQAWARLMGRYGLTPRQALDATPRAFWPPGFPTARVPVADQRKWRGFVRSGHAYTRQFFAKLDALALVPLNAGVPVGSRRHRLATAVDVVCAPRDAVRAAPGRGWRRAVPGDPAPLPVVLLELKCGFRGRYTQPHTPPRMRAPLQSTDTSFRSQHQLQLLLTRWLFESTFCRRPPSPPAVRVARAAVVVVSSGGADLYEPARPLAPALMRQILVALAR